MFRPNSAWAMWRYAPRVFPYLKPYKKLVATTIFLTAFGVLIGLAQPWPLAFMVDSVLGSHKPPNAVTHILGRSDKHTLLIFAVVAGLGLTIITYAIAVLEEWVNTKLEQRVVLDFRSDLFAHAQRLSVNFHDLKPTGQLMNQILSEAEAGGTLLSTVLPLAQSLVMLVGMFLIAFKIDRQLALLSLTVVPFIYYSVSYYSRTIVPRLTRVRTLEWNTASILWESIAMMRVVAAFARERHEYDRFRERGTLTADARVGVTVRQTVFSLGVNTCTAAGAALILGFGATHVLDHRLTVGELLVLLSYIAAVYQPLQTISSTVGSLQTQLIAIQGACMILDEPPEIRDADGATPLVDTKGGVSFEGVHFSYPGREETLKEIAFDVEPGERVALVGPTGAGKTTLISLLMRFYEPHSGCVRIDGRDVRDVTLQSLREQISVVLQVPQLFSGSISDNIRYGRLDASDEEVIAAARAANALDFIESLPDGFDTELGEGGAQLSVGERQRISVARAFLKDAPILILDEPTSSIDSRTERVILDALDELMEGRTTFVIAHRLSTIRHADRILVMNHGELVEMGTHDELLANDGLYRELHDAQIVSRRPASKDGNGVAAEDGGAAIVRRLIEALEARTGQDQQEAPGTALAVRVGGTIEPSNASAGSQAVVPNQITPLPNVIPAFPARRVPPPEVEISVREIDLGSVREVFYETDVLCPACEGRTMLEKCPECGGAGSFRVTHVAHRHIPARIVDGERLSLGTPDRASLVVRLESGRRDTVVRFASFILLAIAVALMVFFLFFS